MNKIESILDKSDYEIYDDFLNFRIDNIWLDEHLERLYPNEGYKGLIPTLLPYLASTEEQNLVWNRILPPENKSSICPILMCPDDCDFTCMLVVAEIINHGTHIQWRKIGLARTNTWETEKVGSEVQWLEKVSPMDFDMDDYLLMLVLFKECGLNDAP
jgi:hypothetical protein